MKLPKVLVIVGPTAVGKSDLAVKLAKKWNGEVVSADSRQVYKGLNLGSGKITKREMKGVPHHVLDVANPKGRRYTVEDFKRDGAKAIDDIVSRGKLPIICGGTGFYVDALVWDESFPTVPPNQKLRTELAKKTVGVLMKEIKKLDPRRAKSLDPYNKVRIIRAIEIARALGKVPKTKRTKRYDTYWIGLTLPRDILRQKIHTRILKRVKMGMIKEVAGLNKQGVSWKRLYDFGLEYRYISLFLQKKMTKEAMIERLETEIAQYAKRQMQWFKRNPDIHWFTPKQAVRSA